MDTQELWTPEDVAKALPQGWNVYDIWDAGKGRLENEIQRDTKSNIFLDDETARRFVQARAHGGDKLATKAMGIVFRSKVGQPRPSRGKKK